MSADPAAAVRVGELNGNRRGKLDNGKGSPISGTFGRNVLGRFTERVILEPNPASNVKRSGLAASVAGPAHVSVREPEICTRFLPAFPDGVEIRVFRK